MSDAQIIVCQRGARRRYAVPRMFHELGMLSALYTDTSRYSTVGRILERFSVSGGVSSGLASRTPYGIPRSQVFSTDSLVLQRLHTRGYGDLSRVYKKWGVRDANIVYSMYGEDIGFLEWAKAQGLKIIIDVFIHPSTNRILAEESAVYLPEAHRDELAFDREDAHSKRKFELADVLLCPSNWVAEGVASLMPESEPKIRIVPYGSSLHVNNAINETPEAGRILFVGRDPMRKGLHYLAEAAFKLRQGGMEVAVFAAGVQEEDIGWIGHKDEIQCLGALPMDRVHHEYEEADVFVLPSLSEGQAGVVMESMACGCPVITTRESGVDLGPECGVMVPARDSAALADAIRAVVGNRGRRAHLAEGALRQAEFYSMDAWKNRLADVVAELLSS